VTPPTGPRAPRFGSATAAIGLALSLSGGGVVQAWPRAPEIASYEMRAVLDTTSKTVDGTSVLTWTNPTNVPATELRFHLYMNAFRNGRSTFARGAREAFDDPRLRGAIDLVSLSIGDCALTWEYMSPDDGNPDDTTVARVLLPNPVRAGATVRINMSFRTRLPLCQCRTGYSNDFFMLAQWYPKIGVFEGDGVWNCHQYHSTSEFYSDFGRYAVTLDLPAEFEVVGTGEIVSTTRRGSTKVVRLEATGVTDVAFAAQPRPVILRTVWKSRDARDVDVVLFLQPEHMSSAERHRHAVMVSLDFLEEWCGPYPYPSLTLVDPPWHARDGAGGMEYPMLFTVWTPLLHSPRCLSSIEETTIHEVVHQYFQHMLASNEAEEPWLDEGVTSYITGRIRDSQYGSSAPEVELARVPLAWFVRLPSLTAVEEERISWMADPESDSSLRASWEFRDDSSYERQSYNRPHLVLRGIENSIGQPAMKKAFRTYFSRYAFRHPRGSDFMSTLSEVAGHDLRPLLETLLGEAETPDMAIADVQETWDDPPRYSVTVRREKAVPVAVDLRVEFSDGSVEWKRWDGAYRYHTFVFDKEVVRAEVDPQGKLLVDTNRINNSWMNRADRGAAWSLAHIGSLLIQILTAP